ncbi:MAG: N-acetyltransferase family protein [Acidobacteriota bacterium]|mgnify:CR=1 FL=1
MNYQIEAMKESDWAQVREIYLEGLATGNATFETTAPNWEDWDSGHLPHSRLVARSNNQVLGWAALSPVSKRQVYRGVAEVSVYVSESGRGKRIGSNLLKSLVESSEQNGIWTLQASIFPENTASVNLHLQFDFREAGKREGIAKLAGVWRNTVILERRSKTVGIY